MQLYEKYYKFADIETGPGVILRWKPNLQLATREEVTELHRYGYIFSTVMMETIAENDRIDDLYESR